MGYYLNVGTIQRTREPFRWKNAGNCLIFLVKLYKILGSLWVTFLWVKYTLPVFNMGLLHNMAFLLYILDVSLNRTPRWAKRVFMAISALSAQNLTRHARPCTPAGAWREIWGARGCSAHLVVFNSCRKWRNCTYAHSRFFAAHSPQVLPSYK